MPRPHRHLHEAQRPAEAGRPAEHSGGAPRWPRPGASSSGPPPPSRARGLREDGVVEVDNCVVVAYLHRPPRPPRGGRAGADGHAGRVLLLGAGERRGGRRRGGADAPAAGRARLLEELQRQMRASSRGSASVQGGEGPCSVHPGASPGAPGSSGPRRLHQIVVLRGVAPFVVVTAPATSPAPRRPRSSSGAGGRAEPTGAPARLPPRTAGTGEVLMMIGLPRPVHPPHEAQRAAAAASAPCTRAGPAQPG